MSNSSDKIFDGNRMIRRFERSEIILHWVNAVPFLVLFLTGALNILSRFEVYSLPSIGAIRVIHKIAGVLWIAGIGYAFFFVGRELNIANTRDQFKMSLSDLTWMIKTIRSIYNRQVEVPPVGKFNIGQKINALMVILYAVAFVGSGALMWAYKTMLFPWYFHALVFFMTIFSLGGHLYLSFVHPSTRPGLIGIFTGMVPRSYVAHHHGLMIKDTVIAHRATTAKSVFTKTERPPLVPERKSVSAFQNGLQTQDRQKSIYRHSEPVPAVQSSFAEVCEASPRDFQLQQPQPDPDACLVAASHGSQNFSREEIDMQKAWGKSGDLELSRRQ